MIVLCRMIYAQMTTPSTCWEKEWLGVTRIWNLALSTPKWPLGALIPVLAYNKHMLLWSLWEWNNLHDHRSMRVYAINEIVPLVVLMAIHYKVHVWCFTLKHVNEQWWLVEHVHVIVRSHHTKKHVRSTSHMRQLSQAWWLWIWCPLLWICQGFENPRLRRA